MLTLKTYQENCLNELSRYFELAQYMDMKKAFEQCQIEQELKIIVPYIDRMNGVPSVCLRVPTGGGKTLLASYSISRVATELSDNSPLVIWLVPSDVIRDQTLKALENKNHPYRQAIDERFANVKICDIGRISTLNQYDFDNSCIILVSTIQAFNIDSEKTHQRNAYAFDESLSKFFTNIPQRLLGTLDKVTEDTLEHQKYLTQSDIGKVKHSLINLFHIHEPIIIVDEAHKNRGGNSFFETLQRLNPKCLVEFTATPKDNNVIYSVSAAQLKADQMIKLPVILTEHPNAWEDCIRDAVLQRQKLETIAQKAERYVRPILLIQAQDKNGEATVEVVKNHLINDLHIDESWIAVATGEQKELEGIDLFERTCPIRIVITVQALKEGWDCAYAYVLASLQNIHSKTDVEQLLGRVLRMPDAKEFDTEALNKSYAHVISASVSEATTELKDRMVQNMGFEPWEADTAIFAPKQEEMFGTKPTQIPKENPIVYVGLPFELKPEVISDEIKPFVHHSSTTQGTALTIKRGVSDDDFEKVVDTVLNNVTPQQQKQVKKAFDSARKERQSYFAPENWNVKFALIPQLGFKFDNEWYLADKETIEHSFEWDLLDYPIELDNFEIREESASFSIDFDEKRNKVIYGFVDSKQMDFDNMQTTITDKDLVNWLDGRIYRPSFTKSQLRAYLVKLVDYLINDRKFSLTQLQRAKFTLEKAIKGKIDELSQLARKKAFQSDLFGQLTIADEVSYANSFEFRKGIYPVRHPYQGSYSFHKHFYETIDNLTEKTKDGKLTHEFVCATVINNNDKVKHWVRNIPQQPKSSFWLPTDENLFYPDFVAELTDGRILVVEYKGDHLKGESRVKQDIGEHWAKLSGNVFIMLYSDGTYNDMKRQIDQAIS